MKIKVLFLDDEIDLCKIFSEFFSTANVEITTFTDPQQAIEHSLNNDLDIIFLDYRMPKTNGDVIAGKMPKAVPKYLLTGELQTKLESAYVNVIRKPFEGKDIKAIFDEALKNKKTSARKSA